MIIAVATENKMVAQHFGRCPEYTLFSLASGEVFDEEVVPNPGHEPGFLPGYLANLGVGCIIAGGMGHRAQSLFEAENIKTLVGISGPIREVVAKYLAGELEPGSSTCEHMPGEHGCC